MERSLLVRYANRSPRSVPTQLHASSRKTIGTLVAAALGTAPTTLAAQSVPSFDTGTRGPLEEVVVTARNREELAQSVPIPTSVVGGRQLERDNSLTALDFANKVPSLNIVQNQPRQSSFSIRGIGKNNSNEFTEGSVGVILDNVYVAHPGASWGSFYDLQRVEVARGPQGTLLGKNTTLGVVNIVPNLPEFEPKAKLELSYGDHDTTRTHAVVTGPIASDSVAYRVTLAHERGDGPIENVHKPGETLNDRNRFSGRLQLLAHVTDRLTARFSVDMNRSNELNGAWPFNYGDPETYRDGTDRETYAERLARFEGEKSRTVLNSWDKYQANDMGRLLSESKGWSGQLEYDLPTGHSLTSITAGRSYVFRAHNDYDILDTGYSGGYVRTRQFSQELRIASPAKDRFDYQAGIYFLDLAHRTANTPGTVGGPDSGRLAANEARFALLDADEVGRALLVASRDGVYTDNVTTPEVESFAVYGQTNVYFGDRFTLTTGLRRTWESRFNSDESLVWGGIELDEANFPGATAEQLAAARAIRGRPRPYAEAELDESSWSWLINPSFELGQNALLYASVAYGERSGTVSIDTATRQPRFTRPERTTDYELGVKSTLLDGRLRVNANLFFTDVRDYQVTLREENPTAPGEYMNVFSNAERVTSKGLELDVEYAVTDGLSLSATGAWSPSRYDSWQNGRCPADVLELVTTLCDNSGKRVQGSSDRSLTLSAYYQSPWTIGQWHWHAFAANIYRSALDTSPSLAPEGHQGGFSVVNAGVGLSSIDGKYSISLDARNVFDKIYLVSYNDYGIGTIGRAAIGQRRFLSLTFRANFAL